MQMRVLMVWMWDLTFFSTMLVSLTWSLWVGLYKSLKQYESRLSMSALLLTVGSC